MKWGLFDLQRLSHLAQLETCKKRKSLDKSKYGQKLITNKARKWTDSNFGQWVPHWCFTSAISDYMITFKCPVSSLLLTSQRVTTWKTIIIAACTLRLLHIFRFVLSREKQFHKTMSVDATKPDFFSFYTFPIAGSISRFSQVCFYEHTTRNWLRFCFSEVRI